MEERGQKVTIGFGILLILCIIGWSYFYFIQYRPLSNEAKSLRNQVSQLQSEIIILNSRTQEPESQRQAQATVSKNVQAIGEIYFNSGYTLLTKKNKKILREIGDKLQNFPDVIIQVVGHSDDVPIGRNLVVKYLTNWELSVNRALTSARYLREKCGIDPTKVVIIGMSQNQPKASNKLMEGRSQNRRVEIKIVQ